MRQLTRTNIQEHHMSDYGNTLSFGTFITPVAQPVMQAVDRAIAAERAGLDLVTFQDHPYQPAFHETWTLLSYVASRTSRISLSGNVLNLPLRNPAVLARAAASLDLLSGGRFEMGLGAGAFWDPIAAMGGRRLQPGQAVESLEEAIGIMRTIWDTSERGGVHANGSYYQVNGAKRGPAPAHDIGIWLGALKPRMLRLTGRLADGWMVSLPYLERGPVELATLNRHIDEGAMAAGRSPSAIRRMLNISGQFTSSGQSGLVGPPRQWAEYLAELALNYGVSGFILASDDARTIEIFADEVAPATRELVASERAGG
jgi:alkanesulfonate monooxygenase SsuD/methylene tetrahydromethanopterin reductase-like flavin-dependent oxidoreductase (luciferase family)